jgi:membrane protease YdiL (CAAX protease family)/tetratricopeptide (TPR) repeat protein
MFVACPACQLDVLADSPGACPRCGAVLEAVAPPTPRAEAQPLVAIVPTHATEPLPEPGIGWAIMSVFLSGIIAMFLTFWLRLALSVFLASAIENHEFMLSLGFATMSVSMWLMGWTCLQPLPRQRLGMRTPRALHVAIACVLPLAMYVVWESVSRFFQARFGGIPVLTAGASADFQSYLGPHWYSYWVLAQQPWLVVLIIGCLLPAISEEIFFRGYVGRGLVARHGAIGGVLLTSLLFGLVHAEPMHVVFTFCFGLVVHGLFLCSQSIWPPMLMHAIGNVVAFGLTKLLVQQHLPPRFIFELSGPWMTLAAAAFIGFSLWLMWRTRRTWQTADGGPLARSFVAIAPPVGEPTATLRSQRGGVLALVLTAMAFGPFGAALVDFGLRQRGPFAALPLVRQAEEAVQRNDHAAALRLYSQAVDLAPDDAVVLAGRSYEHSALEDPEKALADADRSLALAPNYNWALAARAMALAKLKRPREAMEAALAALRQDPNNAHYYPTLAYVAATAERYDDAIAAAEKGRKLDRTAANCPYALSDIYVSCPSVRYRDPAAGLALAREACELTSHEDVSCLTQLAAAHLAIGNVHAAIKWLREAERLADGQAKRHVSYWARDLQHYGPALLELRAAWHPDVIVDDISYYPLLKKCIVLVPKEQVPAAKRLPLSVEDLEGWQHEVSTAADFEARVQACRKYLEAHTKLTEAQSHYVACWLALEPRELLSVDDDEIAGGLDLSEDAVSAVKRDLRRALEAK